MFSYDLVSGHRIIFGNENVFNGCEHHRHPDKIPLSEATRLLFNRCTGLFLAKELLHKPALTADEADFVGRNLAKAQLALGDAVLAAHGQYHWSCLERRNALSRLATACPRTAAVPGRSEVPMPGVPAFPTAGMFTSLRPGTGAVQDGGGAEMQPGLTNVDELPWISEVKKHHAAGVEFKLHPEQIIRPIESFQAEHETISGLAEQVWLWLESRRLNETFSSVCGYAFSDIPKCSGSSSWRNAVLNVKTFGALSVLESAAMRYPRERLLNSLPLLLWDEPVNDLKVKRHLQKQLRTTASDWQGFAAAYKAVWPKFS